MKKGFFKFLLGYSPGNATKIKVEDDSEGSMSVEVRVLLNSWKEFIVY